MTAIDFDDEEIKTLFVLVDIGLKTHGLNFYNMAARLIAKLPHEEAEPEEKKNGQVL